jgi:hypothetical protein
MGIGAHAIAACTAAAPGATQVFARSVFSARPPTWRPPLLTPVGGWVRTAGYKGDKTVKGLLPVRVG